MKKRRRFMIMKSSGNVSDIIDNYLTIEALEDGLTAMLSKNTCEYCVNGNGNWKTLSANTESPIINKGQTLSFRGNLTPDVGSIQYDGIGVFTVNKNFNLKGNCMSMLFGDEAKDAKSLKGKDYAFCRLFVGCTTLKSVSKKFLPATTLATYCYNSMFKGCTSLTTAPVLNATTLEDYCYTGMFSGCTSLTNIQSKLRATTLAESCYGSMFWGCEKLTTAPELPATTLTKSCYYGMFYGCTSLTDAPVLPATTLAVSCYSNMFNGCSSLTTAPVLPATTLADYCYYNMFSSCSQLNYIEMLATNINATDCLKNWVSGVAPTGIFVKDSNMKDLTIGDNGIPTGWTIMNTKIDISNYLTIEALENGLTAMFSTNSCEYCIDGDGNWTTLVENTQTKSINAGQTLSFRGNLTPTKTNGIGTFTVNKNFNITGNCMSMLFGDDAKDNNSLIGKNYAFLNLFKNCTTLKSVSETFLPATTLEEGCYFGLFEGCTSLTSTPSLSVKKVVDYCYAYMFAGCTSLTTAPVLPATTLAYACYTGMFNGCDRLNYIKMLATDISSDDCLFEWVADVAPIGTFFKHPIMKNLPIGDNGIPTGWTIVDNEIKLNYLTIEALEDGLSVKFSPNTCEYCIDEDGDWKTLPNDVFTPFIQKGQTLSFRGNLTNTQYDKGIGTFTVNRSFNLTGNCMSMLFGDDAKDNNSLSSIINYGFKELFKNCTTLKSVSETLLPATILSNNCYESMFEGCTSLVDTPKLPAIGLKGGCYKSMFSGCTSLSETPKLPAINLDNACYNNMFNNCTSLTTAQIKLPAMTLKPFCYTGMFSGCTSLIKSPELPAETLVYNCYSDMFNGCKKLNYIKMLATDINATNCLTNWVYDVSPTGTFVQNIDATWSVTGPNGIPTGWVSKRFSKNYLTIEALSDNLTAKLSINSCEYCIDGDCNWIKLPADTETPRIKSGQTLSFKGNLTPTATGGIGTFTVNRSFNITGNCMSMLYGDDAKDNYITKNYAFRYLFSGCYKLKSVSNTFLPATNLSMYCYSYMFSGCTSLTTAPELPATTLGEYCYMSMFSGCTSLTTAPELPATTLKTNCYNNMFADCTSLTSAPELPATTLTNYCYRYMFKNCINLNYIKMLATNISATNCLTNWISGVSQTGTFIKNICATWNDLRGTYIPKLWDINYYSLTPSIINLSGKKIDFYIENDIYTPTQDNNIFTGDNLLNLKPECDIIVSFCLCNQNNIGSFISKDIIWLNTETLNDLYTRTSLKNYEISKFAIVITKSLEPEEDYYYYTYDGAEDYFTIESLSSGKLTITPPSDNYTLSYKYNNNSWSINVDKIDLNVNENDIIRISCVTDSWRSEDISVFEGTNILFNAKGNILSLLYGDDFITSEQTKDINFFRLFTKTNIKSAEHLILPSTTSVNCYYAMFQDCTALTTAPKLPATTLAINCYHSMFRGCNSLKTAPKLPATTLNSYCYAYMFYDCDGAFKTAPELPATTLAEGCYDSMFSGCRFLKNVPELPATTLAPYCYNFMFNECSGLINAHELPATELANSCYGGMFKGCTSLIIAPELPSTSLSNFCYDSMFEDCTSLTTAPALPATTLAKGCYDSMFKNCSELTNAPELPATTLENYCYYNMFYNCNSLNYINMLATNISTDNCLSNWVYGVSPTGTFVKNISATWNITGSNGVPTGWNIEYCGEIESIDISNYLTIVALDDGLSASLSKNSCQYCIDGDGKWKVLSVGNSTEFINKGQTLSFRGYLTPTKSYGIGTFTVNRGFNLTGNCMSMLFGDNAKNNTSLAGKDYAFEKLFQSCNSLNSISETFLPATTLSDHCYDSMFNVCSLLTTTPALPAKELSKSCYESMFSYCVNLTTTPALPATTLSKSCYESMFEGCTSLTTAPTLPATTLAESCYQGMFSYCVNLTTTPALPATTLEPYCYDNMFRSCTSLTTAPALPATILASYCYESMFEGCTSLTTAPTLPATTLAIYCYRGMFSYCTSLTTAPTLPATTLVESCYQDMFSYCTSLTTAPALPATTLASYCYQDMFSYCTSLTTAPALPATTLAKGCYENMFNTCYGLKNVPSELPATSLMYRCYLGMFNDCTSLTTAPALPATSLASYCYDSMFEGCTSLTTAPELLSEKLEYYCYFSMFNDCSKLNYIKMLATDISEIGCLNGWVRNVSPTGRFIKNINANWDQSGDNGVPIGWSVEYIESNINTSYNINLNGEWTISNISNPDSSLYDGVYESYSNYNVNNSYATMYINIGGYDNFKLYIRSNGENNYDYVMVSQLDKTINNNTDYNDTTLVKSHTRGSQNSGTSLSNYKLVEFTNIGGGTHTITIIYRKDSSSHYGTDKGYVLIPKNQ